jgi:hypothetical protein
VRCGRRTRGTRIGASSPSDPHSSLERSSLERSSLERSSLERSSLDHGRARRHVRRARPRPGCGGLVGPAPWTPSPRSTCGRGRRGTPAQQPGKRKTPRRAQHTRRCARPTGRLGRDDPPLSDRPALAFVPFSFTARQSRSSGGRFPFVGHPPRLPGAAEPTWLARPRTVTRPTPPQPADVVAPVAWCSVADRRCVPPPGRPSRRSAATAAVSSPVARFGPVDWRIFPVRRRRSRLVNPVGPFHSQWRLRRLPIVAVPTGSRPFLGLRLACARRCDAHSAPCVFPGQEAFFKSQGYPPHFLVIPRNSSAVHRSSTWLCTCESTDPAARRGQRGAVVQMIR